jgi:thiosulfate dehydrogenase [quinone] large subunit
LLAGGVLMATLVFGTCLQQNWGSAGNQMVYTVLFALLLFGLDYNDLSLDEMVES